MADPTNSSRVDHIVTTQARVDEAWKKILTSEQTKFTDCDRGMICSMVNSGCSFEMMTRFWPKKTPMEIDLQYRTLKAELARVGISAADCGRIWRKNRTGVRFPGLEAFPAPASLPRISTLSMADEETYYTRYLSLPDRAKKNTTDKPIKVTDNLNPFFSYEDDSVKLCEPLSEDNLQKKPGVTHEAKKPVESSGWETPQGAGNELLKKIPQFRGELPASIPIRSKSTSVSAVKDASVCVAKDNLLPTIEHAIPLIKANQKTDHGAKVKANLHDKVTKADTHRDLHLQSGKVSDNLFRPRTIEAVVSGPGHLRLEPDYFGRRQLGLAEAGSFTEDVNPFTEDGFPFSAAEMAKCKKHGVVKKHHKKAKKVIIVEDGSSASPDSSSSSDSVMSFGSSEDVLERMEQHKHVYHNVYGVTYPPNFVLKADKYWNEDDCKTLAAIKTKDEALKWKRMQAEFYNATGRMVPLELLKSKLEEVKKD